MDRTVKSYPHHLCHAASVITVGLVDLRLQYRPHVPRLDTDHRQARFSKSTVKPLRQWPGFQPNPFEVVGGIRQHRQQCFGKTLRSQKLRMLLTHRKLLQSKAIAIDNDLRGASYYADLDTEVA